MFCRKCGRPVDDGAGFCGNCGAPTGLSRTREASDAGSAPIAEPVNGLSKEPKTDVTDVSVTDRGNIADMQSDIPSDTQPILSDGTQSRQPVGQGGLPYQPDQYGQDNRPANQPAVNQPVTLPSGAAYGQPAQNGGQPDAGKKSKKAIIIAAVAVFAALAVALGVFVVPSLLTGSPEDQLKKMGMGSIKTMTAELDKFSEKVNAGATSCTKVIPGEGLLALLETAGYKISSDITVDVDQSVSKEGTSLAIALNKGDEKLMTASTVVDNKTGDMYLSAPELNEKVLKLSSDQASQLTGGFGNTADIKNLVPDTDAFNIFLSDSYEIFVDGVGEVTRKSDNLVVGDISKKCTVLSADVTERELTDIAAEIAETSKDNGELSDFMDAILSIADSSEGEAKSYGELIDKAVEGLKNSNPSDDVLFRFSVWTENGRDAAGVKIDVDDGYIYYTALSNGGNWAVDLGVVMGESFNISGNGTKSGNTVNGSIAASFNGNELLGLDLVNVNGQNGDGTCKIYLKDGITSLADGLDSAAVTIIKTAKIDITKTTSSEGESLSATVYGAGTELMTVESTVVSGTNAPVSIPEGEIVTDSDEWNQSTDVYFLMGLMSKIGLY